MACAVANKLSATFFNVKASHIVSKWVGESGRLISTLYRAARKFTRDGRPSIIFIDEFDALCKSRDGEGQLYHQQMLAAILSEIDGFAQKGKRDLVMTIGATNRPTLVDPALLRPGRFDELVYVGTPDEAGREHILGIHTAKMPLADDVDLAAVAKETERFTGADLEDVVRRAGLNAVARAGADADSVTKADFDAALEDSRATVTPKMEAEYKKMRGELKKRAVEATTIGFLAPEQLRPARPEKHPSPEPKD